MTSATHRLDRRNAIDSACRKLGTRAGSSYVEYFVVAAAVVVATMALVGKLDSIRLGVYEPMFQGQMAQIKGSVVPP